MSTPQTVVTEPRSRRRWLVLALVAAAVTLRVAFSGSSLAVRVTARLNADVRGSVAIGSIDWPLASAPSVALGGWVPVVLQDVQVRDADGIVVFRSSQVRAEIDVHAVLAGECTGTDTGDTRVLLRLRKLNPW